MGIREQVSRLAPHTQSYDPRVDATPLRGLTEHDLAAAMSRCTEIQERLIRIKWVGQLEYLGALDEAVYAWAARTFRRRVRRWEAMAALVTVAIHEVINPSLCSQCGGRRQKYGRTQDGHLRAEPCMACAGTGERDPVTRDHGVAQVCGLSRQDWQRWRGYYSDIVRKLAHDERVGLARMRRRLR